jgi:hypothetical protein
MHFCQVNQEWQSDNCGHRDCSVYAWGNANSYPFGSTVSESPLPTHFPFGETSRTPINSNPPSPTTRTYNVEYPAVGETFELFGMKFKRVK